MTVKELSDILATLPPDMPVYYKNYSVAGYVEETSLVSAAKVEVPEKRTTYPDVSIECLILDSN